MENKNKDGFSYTYSAKEQAEIRKIRERYTKPDKEEDKMETLRRLDRTATKKAQAVSLTLGIVGALILGLGMSLLMSDLGDALGYLRDIAKPLGFFIGLAGCIPTALAYPIYGHILKKERAKIAPEIIKLTDELLK